MVHARVWGGRLLDAPHDIAVRLGALLACGSAPSMGGSHGSSLTLPQIWCVWCVNHTPIRTLTSA